MSKKKVGFVCSCFDLMHAGHALMLQEAKQHCDFLVVGLQTDPTIDRPEKNKPIMSITERHILLAANRHVDYIFMYATEADLVELLRIVNPSVRFLGDEYINKPFTGDNLNIRIHYIPRSHSYSTTSLRQRVTGAENRKAFSSACLDVASIANTFATVAEANHVTP